MPYVAGPFDQAHYYCQWGGKLPGGEIWSCGMRLQPTAGAANDTDAGLSLPFVATAIEAFHVRAASKIHTLCKLSFVKFNVIGTDGLYTEDTTREEAIADVTGGGSSSPSHPNQVALVATLETGFSRGPAHRGRFYIPNPVVPIASTGLISAADALAVANSVKTMIDEVNTAAVNAEVAVYSRKSGAAAHRLVTGVSVGVVLDTQRRRRNAMIESNVSSTV